MPRRILIIGAHAAAVDAAAAARKTNRESKITLLTMEKEVAYSRCGIPFVIGGHIPNFSDLMVFSPTYFKMMKFNLQTETTVTKVDTKAKTVDTQDKIGKTENLQYDSLIFTTGASPFIPPIKGREKQGLMTIRTIEDGKKIDQMIKDGARTAVVMGAGLIGLEMAVAFQERGLKTTVVELLPQIMPAMLDADMAEGVQKMLEQKGINIMVGKGVEEFLGVEKVTGIVAGGEQIEADIFIAAFGVRANTELARKAGIALGPTRGIMVNQKMETSDPDVYSAGDCTECFHRITQRRLLPQLGTVAVRQGKVAGTNAAGGYSAFPGCLGSAVTKFFDTEIGVTGVTEFAAKRAGIDVVTGMISGKTRAHYFPGGLPIRVKLVVEKDLERVIGGQIVGGEDVTPRVNALSIGIQKQMTARELTKADTCYAPPLSETWEILSLAAEVALKKLRR